MTAQATNYRKNILAKISELPESQLALVDEYLEKITEKENELSSILSYAGIFKELDNDALNGLTVNLPRNRIA